MKIRFLFSILALFLCASLCAQERDIRTTPYTRGMLTNRTGAQLQAFLNQNGGSYASTYYNAYRAALGSATLPAKGYDRLAKAFAYLESTDLLPLFVDGVAIGTNVNKSGDTWLSLKGATVFASNSPACFGYGATFGAGQIAILPVPDARRCTLVFTFSKGNEGLGQVAGLQNRDTIDHVIGVWDDQTLGVIAYLRNNFGGGQYTAVDIPAPFFGEGYMANATSDEHTIALTGDGSGNYTYAFDGDTTLGSTNVGWTVSVPLTNLVIGGALNGPAIFTSFGGRVHSVLLFNAPLTTTQIREAMTFARWFDLREENRIFVGDSMTVPIQDFRINENWPYKFMNAPANTNRYFWRNVAHNGATTYQLADYNELVTQFKPGGPVSSATVYFRFGPNDILQGYTLDQIWGWYTNFFGLAKQDGFRVEALTITPATNFGATLAFNQAQDVLRQTLNSKLLTNVGLVDRVWQVDKVIPDMLTNRSPYSYDGLHQNGAGYTAVAGFVAADNPTPNVAGKVLLSGLETSNGAVSLVLGSVTASLAGNVTSTTNQVSAAQAANYNITANDAIVLMNGNLTATLPTAVGVPGRRYLIKTATAGTNAILTTSSQTIDGFTKLTNTAVGKFTEVISDGANWRIIGQN